MNHRTEPDRSGHPSAGPDGTGAAAVTPEPRDGPATDEAAAEARRLRLRTQGIVPIEPDALVGVMLRPGEQLVTVRRSISLERRAGWRNPADGLGGDLYVTTERLLHLGRTRIECALGDIREAVVDDESLLLLVGEYRGITLHVEDPRVLRVEIAAAREAARRAAGGATDPASDPSG